MDSKCLTNIIEIDVIFIIIRSNAEGLPECHVSIFSNPFIDDSISFNRIRNMDEFTWISVRQI